MDHDDDDELLGGTRFSVGSLLQSPGADFHLKEDIDHSSGAEGIGSISLQWSVTQAPAAPGNGSVDPSSVTPHIVEIAVIDASDLAISRFDTATVQVSLDERASLSRSQSFTKVVPKLRAHWNETFQISTVGNDTTLRFTVWDAMTDYRGAPFLGACVLRTASLTQASQHSEVLTLALRPRQDPRYAKDDLIMLNQSVASWRHESLRWERKAPSGRLCARPARCPSCWSQTSQGLKLFCHSSSRW